VGFVDDGGALSPGLGDAPVHVGHLQGDVDDPVTVAAVVVQQRAARVDTSLDHEPDGTAEQDEGVMVAVAGLRTGVGHQLHAVDRLEEQRGLGGVADRPDHRIPARHRERVALVVVLDQPDQLAQLVQVELGQPLLARQQLGLVGGHVGPPGHRTKLAPACATMTPD
jgi:hypothetical protein